MTDEWLLFKRGLFYRPNNCGYTGIRDEAGRYSYDEAMAHEAAGGKIILASDAPEFLPAAYADLVTKRLTEQRDALEKEVNYLRTLLHNAVREFPAASGLLADSDGLAGYGSLKAMRLHLKIEPWNRPCAVGSPGLK